VIRAGVRALDDVTRLLAELVARPSVNPMGRAVSGPEYREGRVTDYLISCLEGLGVAHERILVAPGRENVVAYHESLESKRTLLWDVHQDTVPVEGMTIPPFEPRIQGDKLYGRGACDVKGSMAAMLVAFESLVRRQPIGAASVILAFTVDEEYTHLGSSRLVEDAVEADLAIVAEPTELNLVLAHKGAVRWKIVTKGIACHSSAPERGDNAIYRMAKVVSALEAHAAELAGSQPHPMLGVPSLSVGRIGGGSSVNIVPDHCEVEIDRRLIPGETPGDAMARVHRFVERALGGTEGFEAFEPWVVMPALNPRVPQLWLERIEREIEAVTGRVPLRSGVPFGTDAGPLGEAGMPCVVLGPGNIAQAHTTDEWVSLGEVRRAAEVYYRIACAFGQF
jgi:acetylornithine deacetylase/succinyl-diaminopimelate desuccinylase-like protein